MKEIVCNKKDWRAVYHNLLTNSNHSNCGKWHHNMAMLFIAIGVWWRWIYRGLLDRYSIPSSKLSWQTSSIISWVVSCGRRHDSWIVVVVAKLGDVQQDIHPSDFPCRQPVVSLLHPKTWKCVLFASLLFSGRVGEKRFSPALYPRACARLETTLALGRS